MTIRKKKPNSPNKRNSKILRETMVTVGALKEESPALQEMHIHEIQVHLLDESGDGVVLCLEYDETTGELKKTFSCVDEYYEEIEVGLEEPTELLDSCISPENVKEFLQTRIEETISEEYDEIFYNSDDDPPPLLN